jgi:predicted nucleic acid-binding protein
LLILDASLALEIFVKTPLGMRHTERVLAEELYAPHLIDVEFLQALRRLSHSGRLSNEAAGLALDRLRNWPIERYQHTGFIGRIWELRNSVSAYDAVYVALAEALGVQLATCDAKLSRSHGHRADIVLLK